MRIDYALLMPYLSLINTQGQAMNKLVYFLGCAGFLLFYLWLLFGFIAMIL